MGCMTDKALAAYERNLLQSNNSMNSNEEVVDEDSSCILPTGQENETLDALIKNELSKAHALEKLKQDINGEMVTEAIDSEFASVLTNLLSQGLEEGYKNT